MAMINAVLSGGRMNPEFVLPDAEIARTSQPTLWLWGEDDPFGGVDIGQRIHSQMKNSQFVSFENSSHLPWLDRPEEHAARIREFLGDWEAYKKGE